MNKYTTIFFILIFFSAELVFAQNTGTLTDNRDGKTYKTVKIGNQWWMAENLAYNSGSGCWAYDNNSSNVSKYGYLYDYETATNVCPDGWHLPSDDEWKTLEKFLGMSSSDANIAGYRGSGIGDKLKSTSGWKYNGNGTNSSGFNAFPGGFRYASGSFDGAGNIGVWWGSSPNGSSNAWYRGLYNTGGVSRDSNGRKYGISVRCLTAEAQNQSNNTNNGDYPEMVRIPGGTFQMGSNDGASYEKPIHSVTVSTFYMGKYEVTNEQYIAFLNDVNCSSSGKYNGNELIDMDDSDCAIGHNGSFYFKGSSKADNKKCPVIYVTWYGADEYCKWLSKKTGETYRLPTEAEWEYAAGGGSSHQKWAGTNSESSLGDYAWYSSNSSSKTHPVGQKKPNSYGLYDMTGNVWEWCQDWYGDYSSSSQTNPQGPTSGLYRVARGGCWINYPSGLRCASRGGDSPSGSSDGFGFRIIKTP